MLVSHLWGENNGLHLLTCSKKMKRCKPLLVICEGRICNAWFRRADFCSGPFSGADTLETKITWLIAFDRRLRTSQSFHRAGRGKWYAFTYFTRTWQSFHNTRRLGPGWVGNVAKVGRTYLCKRPSANCDIRGRFS